MSPARLDDSGVHCAPWMWLCLILAGWAEPLRANPDDPADASPDPAAVAKPLAWSKSLTQGLKLAQQNSRPVLIRFEGIACPHCKVMAQEIVQASVQAELSRWTLISLDIDESPEEAKRFAVESIPAFRLLTPAGKVVAAGHGVLKADDFIAWLKQHDQDAGVMLPAELTGQAEPSADMIVKLIQEFRNRDATIREAAIRRLLPFPQQSASLVVAAFSEGNLATRLSARELLREWKAPIEELDPWRKETLVAGRLQALTDWAGTIGPATTSEGRTGLTAQDMADAKAMLVRLLAADPAEAVALRERLARFGPEMLPEVYAQLQTVATDEARERLTAVRYRLVATDALVLNWPGGIDRLSSTDVEVRHRAADELARRATAADEPLILELFSDSSALVRELSLRALKDLGGENVSGALLRLLEDPEPNVRAAVLKQLVESPPASVIPRIAKYASTEQDSDLVVHAIRVLREAPGKTAFGPLSELLHHESWQVRAEAADALGNTVGRHSTLSEEDKVEIYVAMVELLKDADSFVVSRAVSVLAKADLITAVQPLANAAEAHPELAAEVVQALSQGHKQRSAAAAYLRKFCTHEIAKVRAAAISGLCAMQDFSVDEQLTATLQDSAAEVRIAAATGLFGVLESRRQQFARVEPPDESQEYPVQEEAPSGGLLGSVLKLLGSGKSATPKPVPVRGPEGNEIAAESDEPADALRPSDAKSSAASTASWDTPYEQQLRRIRQGKLFTPAQHGHAKLLLPFLDRDDAEERTAGALALEALGHDAEAIPVLTDLAESPGRTATQLASALAWMLAEDRQKLWDILVSRADDPSELYALASTISQLQSPQSEANLWKLAADPRMNATAAESVRSALSHFYLANYEYNLDRIPARLRKTVLAAAGSHAEAGRAWERIIALSLLLAIDAEAAGEQARIAFDNPELDAQTRVDAFQIQLTALNPSKGERLAVERLSDGNGDVARAALSYLTLGPHAVVALREGRFHLKSDYYGSHYQSGNLGEPIAPEPPEGLTTEAVLPLLKSPDRRTAALAGYLLALLKRNDGLAVLVDYWTKDAKSDVEWTRLVYRAIACLDDSRQISVLKEIFDRWNDEQHRYYLREYYWTIRSMTGPEILALRKAIRNEVGIDQLK